MMSIRVNMNECDANTVTVSLEQVLAETKLGSTEIVCYKFNVRKSGYTFGLDTHIQTFFRYCI